MKKLFFTSLILQIFIGLSAQVTWLNPTPSGIQNVKIQFINKSTGYLMNANGDLFISRDTGNTWQNHGHFFGAQTFRLHDSMGMISGLDSSIYLSTDYGESWQKINTPTKYTIGVWCEIIGSDTLFVLALDNNTYNKGLYRSINRGQSWQLMKNEMQPLYGDRLHFLSSQKGIQLKPDGIYRTTDGGTSWQQVNFKKAICVKFYDTLHGIAILENESSIVTDDGGITWYQLSNFVFSEDVEDIFFIDSLNIYAAAAHGLVYKSTDGGVNWSVVLSTQEHSFNRGLHTLYFFDNEHGLIGGLSGRIFRTRDGGNNWKQHSPNYDNISGISFGNETTGYFTTRYKTYKTEDAGKTWRPMTLSTDDINKRFEYCYFTTADTGFVGAEDQMYQTVDGGEHWNTYPLGTAGFKPAINFFSRDTGYLASPGQVHILYKTTDGGRNWYEVGRNQRCDVLFFLNDTFGYSTLYDRVYRTSDGGVSWLQLPVPPASQPFTSMWFLNPAKGFTVGGDGQLKMTLDSGYSWTDIRLEPFAVPNYWTISFYNDKIGYITDDQGGYYVTIDGGYRWKKKGTVGHHWCHNILFRPDTTVLFAGQYGAIATTGIADYSMDSVKIEALICGASIRADIGAVLLPIDSIWFEYGKVTYTDSVGGTPSRVIDTTLRITATLNNLEADSLYHVRVKILFGGKYYYSPDFVVKPQKPSAPVITASGNILTSSISSGNQWYLNGAVIINATSQQYVATSQGTYSVIATQGNCTTPASAPYNYTVTSVPDINAWGDDIKIFPNPVIDDEINIVIGNNNRRLILQITDMSGRRVKEQGLNIGNNSLSLGSIQSGLYIFSFTDAKTRETVKRKVMKL